MKNSKTKPKVNKTTTNTITSEKDQNIIAEIIVDTREQIPWTFINCPTNMSVVSISTKLDAGDYQLKDHEVFIERKKTLIEFLGNIGSNWERFRKELSLLSNKRIAQIVIEDDLSKAEQLYSSNKGYGKYFNLSPNFILKRVAEIKSEFNVDTIFMSNRFYAERYVLNLFRGILVDRRI